MPARKTLPPIKRSACAGSAEGPASGRLAPASTAQVEPPPEAVDAATLAEIFRRFHAAEPEPKGELHYVNPFTLLVAVVLSAQATDRAVNLATRPLFAVADTPEKMLALGEETIRAYIRTIGLFNTKAKNVVALSRILVQEHGGSVPASLEALQVLPGVGAKTASVVLNIAFQVPRIAVDTHIFRVSNRIPLVVGTTTDKVQAGLEAIVPEPYRLHAHHWLILHGRYTCKARRPECPRCLIADLCRYPSKTTA
ncbi:endonuclease III [Methylobacterium sp. NEAU K]|uniref:endonuclease III n=1 Tax=Methylobacterium sp. NEAU K TaxID=3064946 RepID=UPI0027330012|nr:endonuclease III [Methylobacterium sp. NEAU K]MDP4004275.1 endonuclease III [Methylobacterium sp. NEAU K]